MFTILKETSTRMQIENREVYGLAETIEEAKEMLKTAFEWEKEYLSDSENYEEIERYSSIKEDGLIAEIHSVSYTTTLSVEKIKDVPKLTKEELKKINERKGGK